MFHQPYENLWRLIRVCLQQTIIVFLRVYLYTYVYDTSASEMANKFSLGCNAAMVGNSSCNINSHYAFPEVFHNCPSTLDTKTRRALIIEVSVYIHSKEPTKAGNICTPPRQNMNNEHTRWPKHLTSCFNRCHWHQPLFSAILIAKSILYHLSFPSTFLINGLSCPSKLHLITK